MGEREVGEGASRKLKTSLAPSVIVLSDDLPGEILLASRTASQIHRHGGGVEHGGLCIVSSKEQCLQLWVRSSNDEWVLKEVSLLKEFVYLKKLRREEFGSLLV
jgi:hypothetical protein